MKIISKKSNNTDFGFIEEFEFYYSIKKHGWTECSVVCNNVAIEFLITHVFSDPAYDLIDGLIELVNKKNEIKIIWYEEPGSILWIIRRNPKEHHKLNINLKHLKNHYTGEDEDVFVEYNFEIYEDYFVKSIYCQLLKEFLLSKNNGYLRDRGCKWFTEKFRELHQLLNYKI